jgi:serine/threonine-protein kinase
MCPDENALTRFARGGAGLELPALETHLDGCERCRRAIAAAASEQTLPTARGSQGLHPGQRVARYEVERELGRGGMGIVYQARDVTLDRRVALKLLHERREEAAQARLLREAQVMARLAHPNVVPVFELSEWEGELFLVMELVNGVTLEAWLKAQKHRRSDLLAHFIAAGRGLAAAHAAGVVHRDFKPANVLVGLDGRVRVTDFGLSRPGPTLELPATESAVVTRDGVIIGTLAYMAPEQLAGKVADERSDQFAFCVALVEALTGQRPFPGESWTQLSKSHQDKPRLSGVPSGLRGVLRQGLALEPSRRFASMTALLNALERSQSVGWATAGLTAALAAAAAVLLTFAPGAGQHPAPAAQAAAATAPSVEEDEVPVVVAARDLPAGTVVTFEMLQQRSYPARIVTASVVKPDSASYIINERLTAPLRAGDMLLWSQFSALAVAEGTELVVLAARDLPVGMPLTLALVEQRAVPKALATTSVMKPRQVPHLLGHTLKTAVRKGDFILWAQLSEKVLDDSEVLSDVEIAAALRDKVAAAVFAPCRAQLGADDALEVRWNVRANGEPFEAHPAAPGATAAQCFLDALGRLKFPSKPMPSFDLVTTFRAQP